MCLCRDKIRMIHAIDNNKESSYEVSCLLFAVLVWFWQPDEEFHHTIDKKVWQDTTKNKKNIVNFWVNGTVCFQIWPYNQKRFGETSKKIGQKVIGWISCGAKHLPIPQVGIKLTCLASMLLKTKAGLLPNLLNCFSKLCWLLLMTYFGKEISHHFGKGTVTPNQTNDLTGYSTTLSVSSKIGRNGQSWTKHLRFCEKWRNTLFSI